MVIAEVGAGRGYFTLKLARRVGPDGVVYANDIDAAALRELEGRIRDASLDNVVTVRGEVEDPLLPDRSLDMVFMVYALHDFDRPVALLRNLRRCLDVHTTVVVLDEDPEVTGDHHFLSVERVRELFAKAGYEEVPTEDFLERDLLLVFRIPERS
jgi:ubiquinone/menaquinone biosynthesis C-methylase UbiE